MKNDAMRKVENLIKGITSEEDIAGIEKAIAEAKGRLAPQETEGFWAGKRPCWEMCQCPEMICKECPAPKFQNLPCWEMEGTYCKLDDFGARGDDTSICEICRVYKRWGDNQPINITLWGKGINSSVARVGKVPEAAAAQPK